MNELSELSKAVLYSIDSFDGDTPEKDIKNQFGDEIVTVLNELRGQRLIDRRWMDDDGSRAVGSNPTIHYMVGPSGDYYLEDKGKVVLAELRLARKNETKREAKKRVLDVVCGFIVGFAVGILLGYLGFT